jgi:hypothetical protein
MPPPIRQGYGLNDLSPAFARTLRASLATDLLEQIGFAEKPSPTGRQRCSGRERHACGHATNGRRSTAPRGGLGKRERSTVSLRMTLGARPEVHAASANG